MTTTTTRFRTHHTARVFANEGACAPPTPYAFLSSASLLSRTSCHPEPTIQALCFELVGAVPPRQTALLAAQVRNGTSFRTHHTALVNVLMRGLRPPPRPPLWFLKLRKLAFMNIPSRRTASNTEL